MLKSPRARYPKVDDEARRSVGACSGLRSRLLVGVIVVEVFKGFTGIRRLVAVERDSGVS